MASTAFRTRFRPDVPIMRWFPGHMVQGMRLMQKKLQNMDCVVEVHDARIPLSGRNPALWENFARARPHILLLNKKDLANGQFNEDVEASLRNQGIDEIIWTNLVAQQAYESGFKKVLPAVMKAVTNTDRYHRSDRPEVNVMVIGVPNVGKSCLINKVRSEFRKKGRPAAVGASAGVTRAVQERIKWSADPLVYVLDTPGILEPRFKDVDSYMRLALCSSMSDETVGVQVIADYGLFWLNRNKVFDYLSYFDIGTEPTDRIEELLFRIAMKREMMIKYKNLVTKSMEKRPDLLGAASVFLKAFRTGAFGKVMLDMDRLKSRRFCVANGEALPFSVDL